MKKIPKFVWVLITLTVLYGAAKVAWGVAYPSATWRYKMTVTVETPEGIKTGSAVREIHAYTYPPIGSTTEGQTELSKGEAVVVDLGKRGVFFALTRDDVSIIERLFFESSGRTTAELIRQYRGLKEGKVTVPLEQYPMFVRFRNLKDPKTVENLLDMKPCPDALGVPNNATCLVKDHFEDAFGKGVKLKEVTVEMTDDTVTMGEVGKVLPWFYSRKKAHTMGPIGGSPDKPFEDPTGTYLTSIDFVEGAE